ncbi:hypothetical protein ACJJID_00265 (plasmid) [Microbulbifer sp. CnH-101-G]|uniref:hypothetical protein n=1 Tax=Microbulbifer sp. CnH-101-G TaxID=3243393 RepID=UPI0040398C7E
MADSYKFTIEGNDKTRAMFKSLKANLGGLRGAANSTGVKIAGLAGAAGIGALVSSSISAQREVSSLSRALRVNSQTLSEWQYAGRTVNIEADKMADIMKDVSDKIGDLAVTGGGGAADLFEQLSLDVKDFVHLSPDQQLLKIGQALEQVDSQSKKVFFMEALASDSSLLLPLLEDNAAGLRRASQEARDYGVALSEVDSAKIRAAGDAMLRVQQVGRGVTNQLTIHLAPILETVAIQFTEASQEAGGMGVVVKNAFEKGVHVAGIFADGIHGLNVIFHGAKVIAWGFGGAVVGALNLGVNAAFELGNGIKNFILAPMRAALELASDLPGIGEQARAALAFLDENLADAKPPAQLQAAFDYMVNGIRDARSELHNLMMEDLPSEVMKKKLEEVFQASEKRAEEVAAKLQGRGGVQLPAFASNDPRSGGDDESERERLAERLKNLQFSWLSEMEQLKARQAEELALLQEANTQKLLTHEQYQKDLSTLEERHRQQRADLEKASASAQTSIATSGFDQMLSTVAAHNTKLAALQLGMATYTAGTAMVQNIAEASKIGFPQNIPMIVGATAQGLQIASQLNSLQQPTFAGAYDKGGHIPAGKVGLVGEYGPEFVRGPANVTSRRDTAAMARNAMQGSGRPVNVQQNITVAGPLNRRTRNQLARDSARQQMRVQRRLGQG